MVQRILEAGDIESLDHTAIPRIRTPERLAVFSARAARLRHLAALSNPIAGYLRLMAVLADAQQAVITGFKAQPPSAELIASAQQHSMPLIPALSGVRDPAWHDVLLQVVGKLQAAGPLTPPLEALFAKLLALGQAALEEQADAIFAQRFDEVDPACAPFIMAALQVVWTDLAADVDRRDVPYLETPGLCPVCGSHPVASLVRVGGAYDNYRYLQCGLCATEWHMVRAKCSNCDSTKGIAYHAVGSQGADEATREADSRNAALKAESCDECHTYRKIGIQSKDYDFEPFADDLASLTLDLLMGAEGYRRASPHPWLWPEQGSAAAESSGASD
ncbi:formate dehydrogenase accessory protein FdhE [Paraburkholderia fungorum]|uniref:formate dehydrogenase accessory protein FdhE n=1 Tax=Paraburkholderia fungorum TaxID=134537 RepID=UPI0004A9DF43|nr:formate dehydrogenase accessory protein FdhE [Paraburkholderia fungorum]KFX67291.1 formate dehydrogenase [Burkholderia sp. K24]USX04946.1 formate dehydrogenase accessory protein FdhE [Paraburkholderia fungorum]